MLHTGQRFQMNGRRFTVIYINASRAHCVAKEPRLVTVGGRTFRAHRTITADIAPNTDVDLLAQIMERVS